MFPLGSWFPKQDINFKKKEDTVHTSTLFICFGVILLLLFD